MRGKVGAMNPDEPIMYIIFNKSLKMSKGKVAAQAGHAVGMVIRDLEQEIMGLDRIYIEWHMGSYTKVALSVPDEPSLKALYSSFNNNSFITRIVQDEGRTEIEMGSYTCMAIEPMTKSHPLVERYLSKLRLY